MAVMSSFLLNCKLYFPLTYFKKKKKLYIWVVIFVVSNVIPDSTSHEIGFVTWFWPSYEV